MINFEASKEEIIKALLPLEPAKIILFGSFAYGKPSEESDIDLLIVKETPKEEVKELRLKARRNLRNFIFKNHIGIDIVVDSQERIDHRIKTIKDQFYSEIMEKGKLLYAK